MIYLYTMQQSYEWISPKLTYENLSFIANIYRLTFGINNLLGFQFFFQILKSIFVKYTQNQ